MRKGNFIYNLAAAAVFILLEAAAVSMLGHNGTVQNLWFSKGMQRVSGAMWGSAQQVREYFMLHKRNEQLAYENYLLRLHMAREKAAAACTDEHEIGRAHV